MRQAKMPFARTKDDADLDAMRKDVVRWGDPMAHLASKKSLATPEEQAPSLVNKQNKKSMKLSGYF